MANRDIITLPRGTKVPNHLAMIPDGNRRWARSHGLNPSEGHKKGAEVMTELAKVARSWGIHTLTFWGLSTENWIERSSDEVNFLIKVICRFLDKNIKEANKEGSRIIHLGRKDRLPQILLNKLKEAETKTKNNGKYVFNLALDYGGQNELIRAVQKIVEDKVSADKINSKLVDSYLDTHDQPYPYPDLIIRTSGEQRTSGLLLWQSHYAETYWEHDHLPDLTPEKLREAVLDYSRRRRRFGGNDMDTHLMFRPEVSARLELNWWRLQNIPEGTRFRDFAIDHIKEQFGLSKNLASVAAKHMITALVDGRKKNWEKSLISVRKFYKLIKNELKLAFEPSFAASLQVKLWQDTENKEDIETALDAEDTARNLYSELYRISSLQAAKAAHLRVLATIERNMAEKGFGDHHWAKAEDYLNKFYRVLKERVA